MHYETAIVMIVGIAALVSLRVILAVVGKEYAADHPRVQAPQRVGAAASTPAPRVVRGTGRNSHLLYFPDSLPSPATSIEDLTPAATHRVVPLPRGMAS